MVGPVSMPPHAYVVDDGFYCGAPGCGLPPEHPDHVEPEPVVDITEPRVAVDADAERSPLDGADVSDTTPLGQVRALIRDHVDEGITCPACRQRAQVYRRTITGKMAAFLIELSRTPADPITGFVYIPAMRHAQGDSVKLRYWGLIQGLVGLREDGSNRVGYWRITEEGSRFVAGDGRVPKHVRVYDGESLGYAEGAPLISIRECLGKRFDYDALMAGDA